MNPSKSKIMNPSELESFKACVAQVGFKRARRPFPDDEYWATRTSKLDYELRSREDRESIRNDLKQKGVCVVKLYDEDDPIMDAYDEGMKECLKMLRPGGGSANGGKGMGGITKRYGAACHPEVAKIRLDERARQVHALVYGVDPNDVMTGWDAVAMLGDDAQRSSSRRLIHEDAEKAYEELTGSTLKAHVDVGIGTIGALMEDRMKMLHPEFCQCVQSQLVCKSVPQGGATLVVSPGAHYDAPVDPDRFQTEKGRDFCVCTSAGHEALRGTWRAVEAPRGCLILWLSRTPHGNKLADLGVDPERRVVYISWQTRDLLRKFEGDRALEVVRDKKIRAISTGGTTDHWSTHVPTIYRGSHYSNGKGLTKVLYTPETPPVFHPELWQRIVGCF